MNLRRALLCLILAAATSTAAALGQTSTEQASGAEAKSANTVTLTIAFPDDVEVTYKAIAFREGMTVLDALNAVGKHSRPLKFKYRGSGDFAFLDEIDGIKNEGVGRKNWTYRIDGVRAKVGMGSAKLKAGNHVLWLFSGE
jgi:hypothetical protein